MHAQMMHAGNAMHGASLRAPAKLDGAWRAPAAATCLRTPAGRGRQAKLHICNVSEIARVESVAASPQSVKTTDRPKVASSIKPQLAPIVAPALPLSPCMRHCETLLSLQ